MGDEMEIAAVERFQPKEFSTGAHRQQQDAERQKTVSMIVAQLKIRQWAVEQAVRASCAIAEKPQCDHVNPINIKQITEFFYNFVTKGDDDTKIS